MTAMPSSVNVAGACNNVVSDGTHIFRRQRWESVADCSTQPLSMVRGGVAGK